MAKKSQYLTVWLLPLIIIGGIFYPLLGYLVAAMMAFFLTLSFFKVRYWCWNLCPRGAFLDILLPRVGLKIPIPTLFTRSWFRWLVFVVFISIFAYRIIITGGNPMLIGKVFVSMCLITTVISVILAIGTRHRGWCAICPMGTLQEGISKANKAKRLKS
ncbi:MAG: 4Fe-4S binding protein [Candidatus Omnitrophica bacterium]|nr:4Fe-4S binding protein [Candidatus Omnitrophota bacterium]